MAQKHNSVYKRTGTKPSCLESGDGFEDSFWVGSLDFNHGCLLWAASYFVFRHVKRGNPSTHIVTHLSPADLAQLSALADPQWNYTLKVCV